jgi:hypothetical protein
MSVYPETQPQIIPLPEPSVQIKSQEELINQLLNGTDALERRIGFANGSLHWYGKDFGERIPIAPSHPIVIQNIHNIYPDSYVGRLGKTKGKEINTIVIQFDYISPEKTVHPCSISLIRDGHFSEHYGKHLVQFHTAKLIDSLHNLLLSDVDLRTASGKLIGEPVENLQNADVYSLQFHLWNGRNFQPPHYKVWNAAIDRDPIEFEGRVNNLCRHLKIKPAYLVDANDYDTVQVED